MPQSRSKSGEEPQPHAALVSTQLLYFHFPTSCHHRVRIRPPPQAKEPLPPCAPGTCGAKRGTRRSAAHLCAAGLGPRAGQGGPGAGPRGAPAPAPAATLTSCCAACPPPPHSRPRPLLPAPRSWGAAAAKARRGAGWTGRAGPTAHRGCARGSLWVSASSAMLLSARRLLTLVARGRRGSRCDPRGGAKEGGGGRPEPAGCPQPPASPATAAPAAASRAPPSPPPHAAAAAAAARVVGPLPAGRALGAFLHGAQPASRSVAAATLKPPGYVGAPPRRRCLHASVPGAGRAEPLLVRGRERRPL